VLAWTDQSAVPHLRRKRRMAVARASEARDAARAGDHQAVTEGY